MNVLAGRLADTIEKYVVMLRDLDTSTISHKPSPEKWSIKESLGHLIDSASNNHQRFVRIRHLEEFVFSGYDQDAWVIVQDYQNQEWQGIMDMWYQYNLHMVKVIAAIPDEVLTEEYTVHNLDKIAFKTVPSHESVTLAYFIDDYIDHIVHHMNQIF